MSLTRSERIHIVENGARWCSNLLVELVHNYASALTKERSDHLRTACRALSDFQAAARETDQ
jgi:hypothetical protein